MELLERDAPLDCLTAALASARAGAGRVALVSGSAGLGKTSLVRAFLNGLDQFGQGVPILVGACDDLSTPGRWVRCTTSPAAAVPRWPKHSRTATSTRSTPPCSTN